MNSLSGLGPDREELALIRLDLDIEALIREGLIELDDTIPEVVRFRLGVRAVSGAA